MKYVGTILLLIVIIIITYLYNNLLIQRKKIKLLFNGIDTSLKKRWILLLDFLQIIKRYDIFNDLKLEKVVELNSKNYDGYKIDKKIEIDKNVSKVISKIIEISSTDMNLQKNEQYKKYENELIKLEDLILSYKEEYNKSVKKYNEQIEKFPINLFAILFGFNEEKIMV